MEGVVCVCWSVRWMGGVLGTLDLEIVLNCTLSKLSLSEHDVSYTYTFPKHAHESAVAKKDGVMDDSYIFPAHIYTI